MVHFIHQDSIIFHDNILYSLTYGAIRYSPVILSDSEGSL